jgi:hypothetical protein
MMYKRIFHSLLFITLFTGVLHSQSLLGLYYPMGMPAHGGAGPSLALAGSGVGIGNDFLGVSSNPANLGNSRRTTFSSAVSLDFINLDDDGDLSRHLDMNLRFISLSVPLGSFGAFGVAVEPYSSANSRFRLLQEVDIDGILADTAELGILQSGGSLTWQIGWGYNIRKKVRIGIAYKRLSFNLSRAEITRMRGTLYDRLLDSTRTRFSTNGIHGGIQVPIGNLTVGMAGEYYFIGEAVTDRHISGTRDTTENNWKERYDFKPPPSLALGLAYQFNPQWMAAVDGGMTMWKRFHSDKIPSGSIENANFASFGVQFIPAPNLLTPKLYEITQYRLGMRYTQLPGADASEIAGTLSAGLPLQANGGLFDIIFEYTRRTDTRFENYTEHVYSVKLGINGGRKWSQSSDGSY